MKETDATTSAMSRRSLLMKGSGLFLGAMLLRPPPSLAADAEAAPAAAPERAVTAIVIGAGNRGNVYAGYASRVPAAMKIVGVAEPVKERNDNMANAHNIPEANRFKTWEDVFKKEKFADAVIVTTPDDLHYGPAMAALEKGYDVLLEKPIAQTWQQCQDILDLATKNKRIVAVCHVLRYAPYYMQIKKVIASGELGDIVSIQHMEPVGNIHYSHSYVRGNWGNVKKSTPMILAKSCHDLDILNWWTGKKCTAVNSFGSTMLFKSDKAPEGATDRCLDGCPLVDTCGYSAPRIYVKEKRFGTEHLLAGKPKTDANIMAALQNGPYGRCVFHCDNDQVDHQTVNLQYEGGTTAAFSMEGLTSYAGRRTRIMGTKGDLVGDEDILTVYNFDACKGYKWNVREHATDLGGHGGGDQRLAADFARAVLKRDASLLSSTLQVSMDSHRMGFAAEKSRLAGGELVKL
jgi:predicted dehydrogenase